MTSIGISDVPNLKFLSLNVRGLNREVKRQAIYEYIKKNKVDVCFLQETYSSDNCENKWSMEWEGEMLFSHGTSHSRGVLILFRKGLDLDIERK